jgi:hypothetical protein
MLCNITQQYPCKPSHRTKAKLALGQEDPVSCCRYQLSLILLWWTSQAVAMPSVERSLHLGRQGMPCFTGKASLQSSHAMGRMGFKRL